MTDVLNMWVVYDHPKDFPFGYMARRWEIRAGQSEPTDETMASTMLGEIRARLEQKGLAKLARNEGDDPCILETWL